MLSKEKVSMRYVLTLMLFAFINSSVLADSLSSLTLTDAEMQKLKKYFPTDDSSHLTWKGDPIEIALPVNKEKRIIFPAQVSVDVKSSLSADQLRILNNDKSLYLTALKPFQKTRIYVTQKETGEVVLIDLMTDDSTSNTTQQIDIKKNNNTHANVESASTENSSKVVEDGVVDAKVNDEVSFSDLIRFSWQQVYAPERLIQKSLSYTRAPMHTEKFISDLVYGDKVISHPEGSWVSGNYYVTAVLLRNKYQHKTHINIHRDICGDWQAATIYPSSNLKAYGNKTGDSAMLFLVSSRPFGEVIGVCHGNA
jgi:integrating conjugative element protein (TIGR03749 family)